jgi:transcriptional regulator with GAF, ATPase, and Fis domain
MKAEIVIIKPDKRITCCSISVAPHDRLELENFRKEHATAICLVELETFEQLQKDTKLFYDCGCKHEDKALGYYNKQPASLQLINGKNYKRFGKLNGSIRVLFNNLKNRYMDLLIIIGVDRSLLTEAKNKITAEPVIVQYRKKKFSDAILDLLNPLNYQKDLDKVYVGSNEACLKVKQLISKAADSELPVLILGDTGTGKEIVAQEIHKYSPRGKQGHHMITVNCGAIPDDLFDSEIFGHERGIFTDATYTKTGKWELANNSTLFLDEIGDLSLHSQVKLLRVLEEKKIYRLGGTEPIPVNVRIIAATNKDLKAMASSKNALFRLDLYHRIAKFVIRTQPLSSHPTDIPEIALHLWRKICQNESAALSPDVLARLRDQYWPGNVRSLKHFLERIEALYGRVGIEVRHVDSLIEDEINNYINPPHLGWDGKKTGTKKDGAVKDIQQIESLLKIARKTNDTEKRSTLLMKSQEWLNKLIEFQGQND